MINNAGVWASGKLISNSFEQIINVINTNTIGTILMSRACLKQMTSKKKGLILNVVSNAGITVEAENSLYTASKWAITGFTKSLQIECARDGVRVMGFYPGFMNTDLFKKAGFDYNMSTALNVEQVVGVLEFVIGLDKNVLLPDFGIRDITNF